jgi:hypothetical protein
MFDSSYFSKQLAAQAEAAGADPQVEVHLTSGQGHRVRSIGEVTDGYVVLEVYQRRPEMTGARSHWMGSGESSSTPNEVQRAVIAYESIAQIVITPAENKSTSRIGFSAPH